MYIGLNNSGKIRPSLSTININKAFSDLVAANLDEVIINYEKELLLVKERERKSDNLKMEFLAQVSHELRTPTNTILSLLQMIKEMFPNDFSSKSDFLYAMEIIDTSSKRLVRTIDLLLNTSLVLTETYEVTMEKIDLVIDILNHLIPEFSILADKKGITLHLHRNSSNPLIWGDKYSLSEIFRNLLDNAIKYTEKGRIDIFVEDTDNNVVATIKDTGIGISKEFMEKIFRPFMQESSGYTRKYEGNGLGLTLVKKYCEINHASISAESQKAEGSKFTVVFPKRHS